MPKLRRPRVLLLTSPSTYRAKAFLSAASRLDLDAIQVFDLPGHLAERYSDRLSVSFQEPAAAADWIEEFHRQQPIDAILSVDDAATELAAIASNRLGLPANDPEAAVAARDKFVMRSILRRHQVRCPEFQLVSVDANARAIAQDLQYPVVVKPRRLSGSRGVIRANNEDELVTAFTRTARIIAADEGDDRASSLLIESYLPGIEVAVEGILTDGELSVLAIFDKPDPLEGPYFEETIYTTPSRLSDKIQQEIADQTALAAQALGLRHGPIHAELRIHDERAWLLEVAGRSIGGL